MMHTAPISASPVARPPKGNAPIESATFVQAIHVALVCNGTPGQRSEQVSAAASLQGGVQPPDLFEAKASPEPTVSRDQVAPGSHLENGLTFTSTTGRGSIHFAPVDAARSLPVAAMKKATESAVIKDGAGRIDARSRGRGRTHALEAGSSPPQTLQETSSIASSIAAIATVPEAAPGYAKSAGPSAAHTSAPSQTSERVEAAPFNLVGQTEAPPALGKLPIVEHSLALRAPAEASMATQSSVAHPSEGATHDAAVASSTAVQAGTSGFSAMRSQRLDRVPEIVDAKSTTMTSPVGDAGVQVQSGDQTVLENLGSPMVLTAALPAPHTQAGTPAGVPSQRIAQPARVTQLIGRREELAHLANAAPNSSRVSPAPSLSAEEDAGLADPSSPVRATNPFIENSQPSDGARDTLQVAPFVTGAHIGAMPGESSSAASSAAEVPVTVSAAHVLERLDLAAPSPVVTHNDPRHLAVGVQSTSLGWVEVHAVSTGPGHMEAVIQTQTGTAARELTAQTNDLLAYAREHASSLSQLSVDVDQQNQSTAQNRSQAPLRESNRGQEREAGSSETPDAVERMRPESSISVRV